jgi:hypothetical protein
MGGQMVWFELIVGVIAGIWGVLVLVTIASVSAPTIETDRKAIYGLVSATSGGVLLILASIQLAVKLVESIP